MSEDWKEAKIDDLATLQRRFDRSKREQRPGSIPVISSGGTANPSLNRHHLHPEPALIPPRQDQDSIAHTLAVMEECDCIIQKKVFWIPSLARWKTLQDFAKLPPSTEIQTDRGFSARSYKITSTGKLIDYNFGKEPANSITNHPHPDNSTFSKFNSAFLCNTCAFESVLRPILLRGTSLFRPIHDGVHPVFAVA